METLCTGFANRDQYFKRYPDAYTEGYRLHYWREGNQEVDFVIEWKGKVLGLEVKSGNKQAAGGMSAFQTQIQPDRLVLLGNGGIPWQEFLKINPLELF